MYTIMLKLKHIQSKTKEMRKSKIKKSCNNTEPEICCCQVSCRDQNMELERGTQCLLNDLAVNVRMFYETITCIHKQESGFAPH